MHIDRQGDARVSLWFPAKLDDPDRVKRALVQSLGCALQFDEEENQLNVEPDDDAESTAQASWFFSNGRCDNAFPVEGLTSSGRIDFSPLIASLRPSMLQLLVVGVVFDRRSSQPQADWCETGGHDRFELLPDSVQRIWIWKI